LKKEDLNTKKIGFFTYFFIWYGFMLLSRNFMKSVYCDNLFFHITFYTTIILILIANYKLYKSNHDIRKIVKKWHILGFFNVLSLFMNAMIIMFSISFLYMILPVLLNYIIGTNTNTSFTITKKHAYTNEDNEWLKDICIFNKDYKLKKNCLDLTTYDEWEKAKEGDILTIIGRTSIFGIYLNSYKINVMSNRPHPPNHK